VGYSNAALSEPEAKVDGYAARDGFLIALTLFYQIILKDLITAFIFFYI